MPNYLLSAYELISREVESLYVYIPKFNKRIVGDDLVWYKKHLYVLFTRATNRLVINFEDESEFNNFQNLIVDLKKMT